MFQQSKLLLFTILFVIFSIFSVQSQNQISRFTKYLDPAGINEYLTGLNKQFPGQTKITNLATSAGGREIKMLEIGIEAGTTVKNNPAVLVVANIDGDVPISSLGALDLAGRILEEKKYEGITWYIVPSANPDAAMRYFSKPLYCDGRNDLPHNDDLDEQTDEDGFDDLDGNGVITQMRVKDPAGEWIVVESDPRMMKKADPVKGEKGMYKLYPEGLDNDGDGKYNEDGPGGVNANINFPHLFKPHTASGGLWPGSIDETYQVMKFACEHPEIAMTISIGSTNFCLVPPKGGRKGQADMSSLKIPKNFAGFLNADPEKTYTMQEVMDLVKAIMPPGREVTESMIASMLGLGAMVNPLPADLKFYKELSEKYKKSLEEKGFKDSRLDPDPAQDGSFELWAYYHLGVPSFSMNLWTLPEAKEEKEEGSGLTAEKIEEMSNEEFIELGEEKIAAFLKEIGAPDHFTAEKLIEMVESGQMDTEKIAAMVKRMPKPKDSSGGDPELKALLAFSDKHMDGKGFADWKPFDHPTLGEVEIGGKVPFADNTPPAEMIDSLLEIQVPYLVSLIDNLPRLSIEQTKVTAMEGGVYQLEAWIRNDRLIPFPTAMGEKNEHPAPAVLLVKGTGIQILSGKERTPINKVGAYKTVKKSWLIQTDKTTDITLTLDSKSAWDDEKQIRIGGAK